jgi:hypothetical protein
MVKRDLFDARGAKDMSIHISISKTMEWQPSAIFAAS